MFRAGEQLAKEGDFMYVAPFIESSDDGACSRCKYSGKRCCSHVAKSTTPGRKRRAAETMLGPSRRIFPSPVPAVSSCPADQEEP